MSNTTDIQEMLTKQLEQMNVFLHQLVINTETIAKELKTLNTNKVNRRTEDL